MVCVDPAEGRVWEQEIMERVGNEMESHERSHETVEAAVVAGRDGEGGGVQYVLGNDESNGSRAPH